jgi:hypothetical protein
MYPETIKSSEEWLQFWRIYARFSGVLRRQLWPDWEQAHVITCVKGYPLKKVRDVVQVFLVCILVVVATAGQPVVHPPICRIGGELAMLYCFRR